MTQMLLFDSVTDSVSPVVVPVVPNKTAVVKAVVQANRVAGKREDGKREDGGLNHISDLARLVLLRYDVVAKRRQDYAARRRAK